MVDDNPHRRLNKALGTAGAAAIESAAAQRSSSGRKTQKWT